MTTMAISPKPPLNRPPPHRDAAAAKAAAAEPAAAKSSRLRRGDPRCCCFRRHPSAWQRLHWLTIFGGDEPDRRHLEHQFGPPADRQRRALPEVAQARRSLPAGDQVSRRILPAPGLRGAGLHASAGPGHEVLQRRRHPLEGAVHGDERAPSLRQGGLPAHRGGARCRRRSDPARQSLHPGGRRHSRSRRQRASSRTSSISIARWPAGTPSASPAPRQKKGLRRIAVGDLNVAPLEHDVWSHKQLLEDRLAHAGRGRAVRPA